MGSLEDALTFVEQAEEERGFSVLTLNIGFKRIAYISCGS